MWVQPSEPMACTSNRSTVFSISSLSFHFSVLTTLQLSSEIYPPDIKMTKPAIVIIPGAWHRPKHYQHLIDSLAKVNYEAVGVTMPSVDSSPPHTSWDQDAQAVRRVILEYLDAGKDVIAIAHSFGGIAMSEAAKGLGKQDREKQGLKGAVLRLVYMTAMALPKGQTHVGQIKPVTPEEEEVERQRQELQAKYGGIQIAEVCIAIISIRDSYGH